MHVASARPALARLVRIAAAAAAIALAGSFHALTAQAKTPAEQFAPYTEGSNATVDHSAWSALLARYVTKSEDGINRVDYARFKSSDRATLASYIDALQNVNVAGLDRPEQFAFWANLYNAETIAIVLDAYPVASIKDISLGGGLVAAFTGGPWKAKILKIGGAELSLDDIEHGILRPIFKDPRVHYAVNCASIGCPNIGVEAFAGATLEAQLDAAARAYINHPRGIRVEGGEVFASSIYSWFQDDFGGDDEGVLAHARRYADEALKEKLEAITNISDYGYDWTLNGTAP